MSSAEELPQKPLNELPSTSGVCISTPLHGAAQIDYTSQAQSSTGSFTNASLGL